MSRKRDELPPKSDIAKHWFSVEDFYKYSGCIDPGEPSCWVCGGFWHTELDIKNGILDYSIWDKTKYHRHHIISHAIGGSDDVSNLFLMCKECHASAPHVSNIGIFLSWIPERRMSRHEGIVQSVNFAMSYLAGVGYSKDEIVFAHEKWLSLGCPSADGDTGNLYTSSAANAMMYSFMNWAELNYNDSQGVHTDKICTVIE